MQTFSNLKSIYRRIEKGEKLGKKIKYKGGQFSLEFMDFEGQRICYQGIRKQLKVITIIRYDRYKLYNKPIQVYLEIDDTLVDHYGPEQILPIKKIGGNGQQKIEKK